jgi:hypothetical protein
VVVKFFTRRIFTVLSIFLRGYPSVYQYIHLAASRTNLLQLKHFMLVQNTSKICIW